MILQQKHKQAGLNAICWRRSKAPVADQRLGGSADVTYVVRNNQLAAADDVIHLRTVLSSTCLTIGFVRKSFMPAARHRSRSSAIADAVRAMIGTVR
mmetsp:Transcript_32024/g.51731  ORF Transcript_32024/g.51731 Transcript_32024/m.51731 type:complete len:97 (-) Transcript_32024:441-731(-)